MATTPSAKSQGMKFAEEQLQRHGWTEGKGLGKRESGISEAIKVKVKCDNAGVGHNSAEQFTFHWWDHVFNKTASSIAVEPDQDGVQVKKVTDGDSTVTNKKPRKALTNRDMLYGRFIKSATLLSGGEEPVEREESNKSSSDSSEDEDEKLDLSSATKLTDEDLVKICGGRTAHKGARHGLKMSAKLSRIEEQEQAFLEKYGKKASNAEPARPTGGLVLEKEAETGRNEENHRQGIANEDMSSKPTQCKRKKKKRKKTVDIETLEEDGSTGYEEHIPWREDTMTSKKNVEEELVVSADENSGSGLNHGLLIENNEKSTKKKKWKVASKGVTEEADDDHTPSIEDAKQSKKTKRKEKDELDEELLNGHQEWTPSEDQLSKKKKKSKVDEKDEGLLNGLQECAPSEDQPSKKKKKSKVDEKDEGLLNGLQECAPSEDRLSKKKKKLKRDLQEGAEEELDESTGDYVQSAKKKKNQKRVEEVDDRISMDEEECQTTKKRKNKSKDCSIQEAEAVEGTHHRIKCKKKKRKD